MAEKRIIAHELGHAIVAKCMDKESKPDIIKFDVKRGGNEAYCDIIETKKKGNRSIKKISHLHSMVDLGGIFGELAFEGDWHPWNCRVDVDNFISSNINSNCDLIRELKSWFWLDTDVLSFHSKMKSSLLTDKIRDITEKETLRRLPELHMAYESFLKKIDIEELEKIIHKIEKSKVKRIGNKTLKKYLKRVIV